MNAAFGRIFQLLGGHQDSQVLFTVAKLGFADILKAGPKSGEEVARLAKTHTENTCRVLRAAAGLGIFTRNPVDLKYNLNDVSNLMLDSPTSLRHSVLLMTEPLWVRAWTNLHKAVETGVNPFKEAYGVGSWEYMEKHPEASEQFNKAMTVMTSLFPTDEALTEHYGFKDAKHIVDVAGGQGILATQLLRLNPHLKATTFDQPHVIEKAKRSNSVDYSDVASRFEYASGSFFGSVPAGGDIYLLKLIIHNWDDAEAIRILTTVRNSMPDHGKVVLVEIILKETDDEMGAMMDLQMMVMHQAKERTEREYQQLFEAAGLTLSRVVPLGAHFSAIEAEKKQ